MMTRPLTLAFMSLIMTAFSSEVPDPQQRYADEGYQLVWSDEFDQDGAPDPAVWKPELGFVRNHEDQYYQLESANIVNGFLRIEAKRERVPNAKYRADSSDWKEQRQHSEYTSACLTTKGTNSWTYGRFEMRAKIPVAEGTWPAFWMVGESGEWPSGGEIDIMEAYRGHLKGNYVWGTDRRWVGKWDSESVPVSFLAEGWDREFHIWTLDWTEEKLVISVDGRTLNECRVADAKNPDGTYPFRKPQFLLVNLAVGGDAGGDPAKTSFPQVLEVDYIRVYQKK